MVWTLNILGAAGTVVILTLIAVVQWETHKMRIKNKKTSERPLLVAALKHFDDTYEKHDNLLPQLPAQNRDAQVLNDVVTKNKDAARFRLVGHK